MLIGVAGCVAQAEGAEIIRRAPAVDLVIGPQTYHRLPEALRTRAARREGRRDRLRHRGQVRASAADRRAPRSWRAASPPSSPCRKAATSSAPSASCPIRAARKSRARSRRSSPRPSGWPRPACARSRCSARTSMPGTAQGPDGARMGPRASCCSGWREIPGLARLRYTTSHPRDMDDELIAAHRDLPQLMPYLHLPVQSGSDRILKAMNRRHTAADYLRADRAHPRGAARHRAVGRFHRRLSRRDRRRFRGHDATGARRCGYAQAYLVQIFAAPRHAGRRHAGSCAGSGQGRAAAAAAGAACANSSATSPRAWSAGPSTC